MISLKLYGYTSTELETLAEMFENAYDYLVSLCKGQCPSCPFKKPCKDISKAVEFIYGKMKYN